MTPTRNALTAGLDMRMKGGTKTRRERRGQGGVNSGRVPFLSGAVLPVAVIPESRSGPLTPRPLSPALQAPTPRYTPRSPRRGLRTPCRRRTPRSRGAGGGKPMPGASRGQCGRTATASEAGKLPETTQRPPLPCRGHLGKRTPGAIATTNRSQGRAVIGPAAYRACPQHPGPAHRLVPFCCFTRRDEGKSGGPRAV